MYEVQIRSNVKMQMPILNVTNLAIWEYTNLGLLGARHLLSWLSQLGENTRKEQNKTIKKKKNKEKKICVFHTVLVSHL